jgi:hypothetical protein
MSNSDMKHDQIKDDRVYFFDKPRNVKILMQVFYVCCAILVALDFVINRYTYHALENIWAFYPIYGFIGCVVLVVIAKWMRTFLMRDEDYYDKFEERRLDQISPARSHEEDHHVGH